MQGSAVQAHRTVDEHRAVRGGAGRLGQRLGQGGGYPQPAGVGLRGAFGVAGPIGPVPGTGGFGHGLTRRMVIEWRNRDAGWVLTVTCATSPSEVL
ncbi:uncharacterized protein RMCT_1730 [Mycolicibacterium thermoresistibile]|uniref:Uncharacterized protein n=1 Tax=Mycolicibacterium thermoresistibile TaxID=1797 RepID=A0A100XDR5_MYCTH|nr:uncharacterized protein RMCT_1730 [Mycolicibacterium thermoresistibile]